MKRRSDMTLLERLYLLEVARGVSLTLGNLAKNTLLYLLSLAGISKNKGVVTVQYPEERRDYPPRYRGRHRLTLKDDGGVKCTACFLCATACPARCIYIEPAEHGDPAVEKFPHRYEIDTLLCIYCGYCVEACPVDAIRMDTGIHPLVYPPDPRLFIEDKEVLMARSRAIEDNGREALFKEHMQQMQDLEKRPAEAPVFEGIVFKKAANK